jgi:Tim17/Tim22/Tim23/Pmp24 family
MARRTNPATTKTTRSAVLAPAPMETPDTSFDELGPIGKVVAGVTQIAFTTLLEYAQGYVAGIFMGTLVGTPGLIFKPVEQGVQRRLHREIAMRMTRMNTRSLKWAKLWGGYSAAFGGCKVGVKVLRGGREDNWNSILSTGVAGALLSRAGTYVAFGKSRYTTAKCQPPRLAQ